MIDFEADWKGFIGCKGLLAHYRADVLWEQKY